MVGLVFARARLGRVWGWLAVACSGCSGSAQDENVDSDFRDALEMLPPEGAGSDADPVPGSGAPCEGVVPRLSLPELGGMGTLRIALTQTAASGARYRLQGASFLFYRVDGDISASPGQVRPDDGAEVLELVVASGEYLVTLEEGWSMEALEGSAPGPVPAARLSPARLGLAVDPGADVSARFRFEVQVPGAALAAASVAPTLGVLERPDAPTGRICVESSIVPEEFSAFGPAELAALEGCSEVRGELYLGLGTPTDLSPLSQLERVCGTLSLSSLAPFGPEPVAEQSLAGLEALEEVDALFISHPGVRSLEPLSSLRRIQRRNVEDDVLGLFSLGSGLEDLRGLEQVSEIRSVRVSDSEALRSLRGLSLPAEMRSIMVEGVNLADLSALDGVAHVSESLYVSAGAAEDLGALSNLRSAGTISIFSSALRDATGLGGLETTSYFSLQNSPLLEVELPVFAALTRADDLSFSGLSAPGGLSLPALATATTLSITDNPRLGSVSFPALASVGVLTIEGNSALSSVQAPVLSTAGRVSIVGNPALPADQLAWLDALGDAARKKVGGNAGSEPPLNPCPWEGDAVCDAAFDGVCAPGTDSADCGPID